MYITFQRRHININDLLIIFVQSASPAGLLWAFLDVFAPELLGGQRGHGLNTGEVSPHSLLVPTLVHLALEQLEAAQHCPRLEVSILHTDDLLLHHVLDNVERLFALMDHVKSLNVFNWWLYVGCLNLTLAAAHVWLVQVVPHDSGGSPVVVHVLEVLLLLCGEADLLVHPVHGALHLAPTLICPDQVPQLSE